MKKLYTLVLLTVSMAMLVSCGSSYNIQGSSNVATLDGHKLYLKIIKDESLKNLDSCDVVHGQFLFSGSVDTICMANLYMDDMSILPVVLETGDILVKLNNTQQVFGGTPLNDKLYSFMKDFDQLQNESMELVHLHDQAIMNGKDMDAVNRQLSAKDAQITQKMDKLVTSFIVENFDNVLGPGVFMMVTANYDVPVFTPWIEDILSKATDRFKNDPYVKQYIEAAEHNQNLMNGMAEQTAPAPPAPGTVEGAAPALPTPSDMAKDNQ